MAEVLTLKGNRRECSHLTGSTCAPVFFHPTKNTINLLLFEGRAWHKWIMCFTTSHSVRRHTLHLWETSYCVGGQSEVMNTSANIIYCAYSSFEPRCAPAIFNARKCNIENKQLPQKRPLNMFLKIWPCGSRHTADIILSAPCPAFLTAWQERYYIIVAWSYWMHIFKNACITVA